MFRRQTLHLYRWKQECKNSQKRGEIADNGCIEWFHSVLKSETFYLHKWRNITEDSLTDIVKNYIIFYNETRIQQKLNDQSPVEYRELVVEGVQQPKGASLQIFLPKCVQNIDRIPVYGYQYSIIILNDKGGDDDEAFSNKPYSV